MKGRAQRNRPDLQNRVTDGYRAKVTGSVIVVLTMLLVGGVTNFVALGNFTTAVNRVVQVKDAQRLAAADFKQSVAELLRYQTGYVLSDHQRVREDFLRQKQVVESRFAALEPFAHDLEDQALMSDVEFNYQEFLLFDDSCWKAVLADDTPTAIRITQTASATQYQTLVGAIDRLIAHIDMLRAADSKKLDDTRVLTTKIDVALAISAFIVAAVFMTLVRRLEEHHTAFRRQDARFRALIQGASDVTLVLDAGGDIRYCSPSIETVLGYPDADAISGSWKQLVPVDEHDGLQHVLSGANASAGFDLTETETVMLNGDGSLRPVEVRFINRLDDTNIAGFVLNVRDITERQQLMMARSLGQKLESVGRLAAGVAHEINTPIQYIGNNVHFLDQAFGQLVGVLTAEQELLDNAVDMSLDEYRAQAKELWSRGDADFLVEEFPLAVNQTLAGIQRVSSIVRSMKAFGHPGSSERAPADINDAIDTTIVVARSEYADVADVETELADIPLVSCWVGDLNQVFLNLIINAAHAIRSFQEAGRGAGRGVISISTTQEGDRVVIAISDTGGGIPADIRNRVFDPFFTTKEVGKGTGQGLSMARSVVERHGGALNFEVAENVGTTFFIRLPIDPPPSPTNATA